MRELPKDLTNSLRSFRGSIYGHGQTQQGHEEPRLDDVDTEKESDGYKDKEFDRALNDSQSSLNMQSATSAQDMDHHQSDLRGDDVDAEKQEQVLRFEDERDREDHDAEHEHEHDAAHGAERPRVDTSMDGARKPRHHTPQTPGKQSILKGDHIKDLDPAADRLAEDLTPLTAPDFYQLMGLNEPSPNQEDIAHLAKPHGLYARMTKGASWMNKKYRTFAIAVYVFLVLQLVISAVFIILGSLRNVDTHITIAVLGAVSTVIAGGLALMQGQGLPQRLRKTRDSLKDVIFAADELFEDMRTGRAVLYKDVKKIREDYLRVLEEQRQNDPDMWTAKTSNTEEGVTRAAGGGGRK